MNDLAIFLKNHKHLSNKKIKYYFNVEKLICYNHLSLGFSYMSKTHQYCDLDLRLISLLRHLVTDTTGTLRSIATFVHYLSIILLVGMIIARNQIFVGMEKRKSCQGKKGG